MPTLTETLSQISGISKEEMGRLFQQVKENHKRLAGCAHHNFADITPDKPLNKKYRCQNCQGEIDSTQYLWFTRGQDMPRSR